MSARKKSDSDVLEHDDEAREISPYHGLQMSLEDFLAWEPEADGWKYEWENGIIIGEEEYMRKKQTGIQKRLLRAFSQTTAYQQGGELLAEVDCELSEGLRIKGTGFETGRKRLPTVPARRFKGGDRRLSRDYRLCRIGYRR